MESSKIILVRRMGRSGKIWINEDLRKALEGKYVVIIIQPLDEFLGRKLGG